MTADHPFWGESRLSSAAVGRRPIRVFVDASAVRGAAGWVAAGELRPGDRLRTASGHDATVVGVRYHVGQAVVYTLTVAKDHTFFVGSARVLVHNALPCVQTVSQAFRDLRNGIQEVTVGSRQEAEEVFYRLYANRFHNTTGWAPTEVKRIFGTKTGTYHWDVDLDSSGRVVMHGRTNPHGAYPHVNIYDESGDIITILFLK